MYHKIMTQSGFSSEEADVYGLLLKQGPTKAHELLANTTIKRALLYKILDKLIIKGLATKDDRNGVTIFIPRSPDILLRMADEQLQAIKNTQDAVRQILPRMRAQHILATERATITMYEGAEQLKTLYESSLGTPHKILYFLRPRSASSYKNVFGKWFSHFTGKQAKRGIKISSITPDDPRSNHEEALGVNRTWVRQQDYTSPVELKSYGESISIVLYTDKPSGILIKNTAIAKAFQELFILAKKGAATIPVPHDHA